MNGSPSEPSGLSELSIDAQGLEFSYRSELGAFRLAIESWRVERGSHIALFGPSGCGKSTLLSLLAGVLVPEAGSLVVEGGALQSMGDKARRSHRIRRMGFVFQESPLVDYLDATENVLFPFRLNRDLELDDAARERASSWLEELGLGEKQTRRPSELSVGERQRVAIARALIAEPTLLLADEPTSGLDPEASSRVIDLLLRLSEQRGLTLLVVTHDPAVRARFETSFDVGLWSRTSPRPSTSPRSGTSPPEVRP